MGQKVPPAIKEKVISEWLEAKPRNVIADELGISYDSVSNIIVRAKREKHKRYRPPESCSSFVEKQ